MARLVRRRRRSSSPPTAGPATRRRSAVRIDRWVGDGDSIDAGRARRASARPASRSTARRSTRTRPTRSSRSSPRSMAGAGADHDPRRARRRAARPRARRTSGCSPIRRSTVATSGCSTRRSGSGSSGPGRPTSPGRHRRPRVAAAVRRRRRRGHDRRPALPAPRRGARDRRRRAACRTSAMPSDARVTLGTRPDPRRGDPCYALAMSMPDGGRPGSRGRPPRRDRHGPSSSSDQRGRWTIVYFYPKDDTPGCTIEACEFRDATRRSRERGADVWGDQPAGRARASARSARSSACRSSLLADVDHAVAEAYGSWVEKQNYGQDVHGDGPDDVPRRIRTAGSPGPGRRSSPKATPPRCWRRSTRRRPPRVALSAASPADGSAAQRRGHQ